MATIDERLAHKKAVLDALRPIAPAGYTTLSHWYDVELTCTSNAIE